MKFYITATSPYAASRIVTIEKGLESGVEIIAANEVQGYEHGTKRTLRFVLFKWVI
jgi:hypothetical protein